MDLSWEDGALVTATLTRVAGQGGDVRVRLGDERLVVPLGVGETVVLRADPAPRVDAPVATGS